MQGKADAVHVSAALDDLGVFEAYFAYPGPRLLAALRDRIAEGSADGTARLARRISEALLTRAYKHDINAWQTADDHADTPPDLDAVVTGRGHHGRPYFEMLVVSPHGAERNMHLTAEIRGLRRPEDAFIYEAVPVSSFEDAICAVLVNAAINAVTIYEGFGYASLHDAPVLRAVLSAAGHDAAEVDDEEMALALAHGLKRLRPEIDIYLLSDRHVERMAGDPRAAIIRRVLYSVEELLELHL
jgi:arginine decarboxylase